MVFLEKRPRYRPSGRIDAARLVLAFLLLALLSGIMAAALALLLDGRLYFAVLIIIMPMVLLGAGVRWAAKWAHCRNPWFAGLLGLACGLTCYLGSFHVDQCLRWDAAWSDASRLPEYIAFRMETDEWRQLDKAVILHPREPAPGVQPFRLPAEARWSWNWGGFLLEALFFAVVPCVVGFLAARDPYSEKHRRWCARETLTLEPDAEPALRRALENGKLLPWIQAGPRKVGEHEKHFEVSVWHTPAGEMEETADDEIYLSVGKWRCLQLSPKEAAAFVQLLPGMQDLAQRQALAAEADADPQAAHMWTVPAPYAGLAQNSWNRFRGKCLIHTLMLLPVLAPALLIGGICLLDFLEAPIAVILAFLVPMGLACLVFIKGWYHPEGPMWMVQSMKFDERLLRRAVAERPDPLIAADEPDAFFAELCPRRLWTGESPENGDYNQGLMRLDSRRGEILFEGDYECYRIPAAALLSGAVEKVGAGVASTAAPYAVVLHVRLGSGTWEFPFVPLLGIEGRNFWEKAVILLEKIEHLCGHSLQNPTLPPPRDSGMIHVG